MKKFLLSLLLMAAATSLSRAQVGYWGDVGLSPRTATIDVNTNYNNSSLETGDISITANNNVVMAWEDDDGGIQDWEAIWTLFDNNGNLLLAPITMTNLPSASCIATADSVPNWTYRCFFRADGSPTPGYTSDFGGKAKGNLFGDGFGFGTAGTPACELPQLLTIQVDNAGAGTGDIPIVQLLNNDGSRNALAGGPDIAGILTVSDADAEPDGNIRIADFEYLSSGNILLVGESRQVADRALTGQGGGNTVVYKVLTPAGGVVKAYSAVSSEAIGTGAWHGAAAVSNGFAIRFGSDTGDKIRFFDNAGNPKGPNVSIASVTCHPEAAGGGRGDGSGFKGNGNDAYVWACNNGATGPWVTVFNANGTVRYSRKVADPADNPRDGSNDRLDAAIQADGRVIVVFQASNNDTNNVNGYGLTQARMFDACGGAIGPVFYVSEREGATNAIAGNGGGGRPRVAWRGNLIGVMWGSLNSPVLAQPVLAVRLFDAPPKVPCTSTAVSPTIVPDTIVWYDKSVHRQKIGGYVDANVAASGGSWEPYAGLIGNSTFLLATDTYADDGTDTLMRSGIVFQPASGAAAKLGNGFYDDNNKAWTNQVNLSRQDGNPNRADGDHRIGATNFMAGMEASLYAYSQFNSDGRFNPASALYAYMAGGNARFGAVQTFGLNTTTLDQTVLSKAQDSAFGGLTGSTPPAGASTDQLSRFGGHIVCLDNGNYVSVVEDRSRLFNAAGNASTATIFAPNGSIVKPAFKVADADQWANVAAFQGGFSVRPSGGLIYFFNNAGTLQGSLDHNATSGLTYDTGRGDGTRTASDIRSKYLYMAGVSGGNHVWLSVFNAQTRTFVTKAIVDDTDPTLHGLDRVNLAVDAADNVCVVYKLEPVTIANGGQFGAFQVAARVMHFDGANINYISGSFWPFINHDNVGDKGIATLEPSVAMTTSRIFISAKGVLNSTNNPAAGGNTANNTDVYTVINNPAGQPAMSATVSAGNIVISWDATYGGRCLQSTPSLTAPVTWTSLNPQPAIVPVGNNNTMTVPLGAGPAFFRLSSAQ